jgi:hypothetical protein
LTDGGVQPKRNVGRDGSSREATTEVWAWAMPAQLGARVYHPVILFISTYENSLYSTVALCGDPALTLISLGR